MSDEKAQNKKKYRTITGGFIKLPKLVLFAKGLSRNAKALYAVLLNYSRENMECYPAQKTLAEKLNVSVDTIRDDLAELKEFGLITIIHSGLNRPNTYQIIQLEKVIKLHPEAGKMPDPEVENLPHQEEEKKPAQDAEEIPFQEAERMPNKIEDIEVEDKRSIYTTLTLDKKLEKEKVNLFTRLEKPKTNRDTFDIEAKYLAEELNDLNSIKFYQKVVNRRNKGEITDEQIQKAFLDVKQMQSISNADGTKPLERPGAMFNKRLKELVNTDKVKNHQVDLTSLTNSKKIQDEKPNLNELRNKALKSISMISN